MNDIACKIFDDLNEITLNEVNAFIAQSSKASIYQNPYWVRLEKEKKITFYNIIFYKDNIIVGFAILRGKKVPIINRYIYQCVRGPVANDEAILKDIIKAIATSLSSLKPICITISPYWQDDAAKRLQSYSESLGYVDVQQYGDLHDVTLTIDLSKTSDEILMTFRQTTRYEIKKASRLGLEVVPCSSDSDFNLFYSIYAKTASRKKFKIYDYEQLYNSWKWLLENPDFGVLFISKYKGDVLSGALILKHGCRAVYTIGASSAGIHKGISQNQLVQWHCIEWAKSAGCELYDLGGYYPGEGYEALKKANTFKLGFSDQLHQLFRRHTIVYSKLLYHVYILVQKVLRK